MPRKGTANPRKSGGSSLEESAIIAQGEYGQQGAEGESASQRPDDPLQEHMVPWSDDGNDSPTQNSSLGDVTSGIRTRGPSRSRRGRQSLYKGNPDNNPQPRPLTPRGNERREKQSHSHR